MARRRKGEAPTAGLAAVILAAGASRRLGQCKALVELEGQTILESLVRAAQAFDGAPPLVVVGAHAGQIEAQLPAGCEMMINPNWEEGRTGGLALAARQREGLDLAVLPVDVPRVGLVLCQALRDAWRAQGSPKSGWLAPRFGRLFGHPVLLGRVLARRLASFGPDQPLSELRQRAAPLLCLETNDARVLEDLDTPLDLSALLGDRKAGPSEPSNSDDPEDE